MIGKVDTSQGSTLEVTNGTLTTMLALSGTIDAFTFVEISNGKLIVATTKIDGVTVSKCTSTTAGKVYIL